MGANTSKSSNHPQQKPAEVDFGSVFPTGIYPTAKQDYLLTVRDLIKARRLAPFYKGLNDPPEPAKEMPAPVPQTSSSSLSSSSAQRSAANGRARSASSSRVDDINRSVDRQRLKQRLYNDAVECPICFLYYPANTNYSRCCEQPICTECFVQLRRACDSPDVPVACPFCLESNFGVVYRVEVLELEARPNLPSAGSGARHTTSGIDNGKNNRPRAKSVSHSDSKVVLVDHIHPDWKKELAQAVQSTRSGSRRNSAGQSGSRNLLRTAQGQLFARPGRSASSAAPAQHSQIAASMRNMHNLDIEDLMVMEAIRLSLLEDEERKRREAQENTSQGEQTAQETGSANDTSTGEAGCSNSVGGITGAHNKECVEGEENKGGKDGEEDEDDDDKPLINALGLHNFSQRINISSGSPSSSSPSSPSSSASESESSQAPTESPNHRPDSEDAALGSTDDKKSPSFDEDTEKVTPSIAC